MITTSTAPASPTEKAVAPGAPTALPGNVITGG